MGSAGLFQLRKRLLKLCGIYCARKFSDELQHLEVGFSLQLQNRLPELGAAIRDMSGIFKPAGLFDNGAGQIAGAASLPAAVSQKGCNS